MTKLQSQTVHDVGMALIQQREFERALPHLKQAVQLAPEQAEFHNNLANAYQALGQTALAAQHYREALRLKSPYPEAHNNLGTLLYKQGEYSLACQQFEKALRMDPHFIDAHFNLGLTYVQLNRLLEATTHFKVVCTQCPDHLSAAHNLGIASCSLRDYDTARQYLTRVIEKEPDNLHALYHLAIACFAVNELTQAEMLYQKILTHDPSRSDVHHNLATLYLHLNQPKRALTHFQRTYQLQPSNQTAAHMIAALSGHTTAEGAPIEHTRALFNQYALNYDTHVKTVLHYQVPQLLRAAIAPLCLNIHHPWNILDLGCGTGLCAPLFSDLPGQITGIDLSDDMLMIAKHRGGYMKLINAEAITYLHSQSHTYDLIIAADVLVYFGSLHALLSAVSYALTPNGLFCFSIEILSENEIEKNPTYRDFQLRPTGRYAHRAEYVETLSQTLGFSIFSKTFADLREQDGKPVKGAILVLRTQG